MCGFPTISDEAMSDSDPSQMQRFFLHYPQGHRLYICIADHKRRAFDFTDDTFKIASKLANISNACRHAEGRYEQRADHGCSYSVEIDLGLLLQGTDPQTLPVDGALITVHWLDQVGEQPDVKVDKRLTGSCSLRLVNGRFEPANKWDADALNESRAFEQRERFEKEHREFVLREIDSQDITRRQLATAVREGDVAAVIRVLAKDICEWAGNLKHHCLHQITHLAKDPFFVRFRTVPENAPFQVQEHWIVREWIGSHEAYNLLEFHKSAEFARSFSERLEELHQARLLFSQQTIEYTVRFRGEDPTGMFAVDEARKDLKHQALNLAYYLETIALQVEATSRADPSKHRSKTVEPPTLDVQRSVGLTRTDGVTLLQQFAAALADYSSVLNRVVIEAYHPEIESIDDAMAWTTGRQAELEAARQSIDRLAGRQLTAAVIPPEGARSDEWTVQLLSLVAESFHAVSYVFTSGPPQSASDDPRAKMAASVVGRQLEAASKALRDIDTRRRHIEATCLALRPDQSCPGEAKLDSRRFESGEIVFYTDRVEICGVDICSGPRSGSRRIVLELLSRRRPNGAFVAYSGVDLETEGKRYGAKGTASGWIRDLRGTIVLALRKQVPSTIASEDEIILSGGPGYRFAESINVQFRDPPGITDITATNESSDVPNDDVRDVFDVPDDAAGSRQAWILQELVKERRLKAPDVAEHFDCSVKTAQRDLTVLKDQGKIEFVGATRTGHYRLRQP